MTRLFFLILTFSFFPLFAFQTINVAAIRVEFVEDNNALTTGNGLFAVDSVTNDPFAIDPAPHNRTYFKDQIIAADNYFNNVSKGKVRVTGNVFPAGLNSAYKLPKERLVEVDGSVSYQFPIDLTPGVTYYFAVTAYDIWDNETGFSNKVI